MKLYYYKNAQGNFGDDINGWLWEELIPGAWDNDPATLVSVIGTILGEDMPSEPPELRWIVMSSGTGYAPVMENIDRSHWDIVCVRGPLTARVLGLPPDKAVTDGAILVALLPRYQPVPEEQRHGVVFMPHHAQTLKLGRWRKVCEQAGITFLDPRSDSKLLLDQIRHAKLVLASAMHAAILADAVRVPWVALEISSETSSFKWLDWCLSMEVDYRPVTLPTSSTLEFLHDWFLSKWNLNHNFFSLSVDGAIKHARLLRARENYAADIKRAIIGKSFGVLRSIARLPVIRALYGWCDRGRVARAVMALQHAAQMPPSLSDGDIFADRLAEMKRRVAVLRKYAEDRKPPLSGNMNEPVGANVNKPKGKLRTQFFSLHAFNVLLRLGSLAAKLGLTLYMGRYLGLDQMGTYGLITAYVAVLVTLLGVRFDYVVSRDIVDALPFDTARKIRDQLVFYGVNYAALALACGAAMLGPLRGADAEIIGFTLLLSILESFAAITSGNFVSLKKPVLANILFFIRAALWVVPVIAMGLISPLYRTADTILFWWTSGVMASLIVTFIAWRHLPWLRVLRAPVDWGWIKTGVRKCFLIWLGVIGATAATYVDRFVVEHYLGLDYVGIVSFYGSFVLAIQSLLQSGIFAFSFPRLISHHRQNQDRLFSKEMWRMTAHAVLFAGLMSIVIGIIVPMMGAFFHRPEFTKYAPTLWLMLLGNWLRSTTEGLYYVLYARHQDRIIWIGGLLALIPSFGCNIIFVPLMGFSGIGYSAIVTAIFLCVWRIYCVNEYRPERMTQAIGQPRIQSM